MTVRMQSAGGETAKGARPLRTGKSFLAELKARPRTIFVDGEKVTNHVIALRQRCDGHAKHAALSRGQ
jgi:hypothetical protein